MWTKKWFFELMHKYDCGELTTEQVWDYVDLHSSASNDGKPIVSGSLPTLEDAWNAGVDEGGTRTGNFEWEIRRKDIEFSEWYAAELEYRSLGQ